MYLSERRAALAVALIHLSSTPTIRLGDTAAMEYVGMNLAQNGRKYLISKLTLAISAGGILGKQL